MNKSGKTFKTLNFYLIIFSMMIFYTCKDKGTNPPVNPLNAVWVTNQVQGWALDTNSNHFLSKPADTMFNAIDGGAQSYKDSGLVKFNFETLLGPNNTQVLLIVSEFGKTGTADNFYIAKSIGFEQLKVAMPGYPESEAIGHSAMGGVEVTYHFNQYFLNYHSRDTRTLTLQ